MAVVSVSVSGPAPALAVPTNRAEQIEYLRGRIAAMSGAPVRSVPAQPVAAASPAALPGAATARPGAARTRPEMAEARVPRGAVAVLSGARSLLLRMVAEVTASGGNVAIVGHPDIGLLAAVEMGADLSRIAVIPDPGADPVEVAAVLIDGMDLVAVGLGGRRVSQTRARAVVARARGSGCTLLVSDGDWHGARTRFDARVCGYEITAGGHPGFGRIGRVRLQVRSGTSGRARTG